MSPNHSPSNSSSSSSSSSPSSSSSSGSGEDSAIPPPPAPEPPTPLPSHRWEDLPQYTGSSSSSNSSGGNNNRRSINNRHSSILTSPLAFGAHTAYSTFSIPPPPPYVPVPCSPSLRHSRSSSRFNTRTDSDASSELAEAGSDLAWDGEESLSGMLFGHYGPVLAALFLCFALVVSFIAGVLIWTMVR